MASKKKAIIYAITGHINGSEHDYTRVMAVTSMRRNRHGEPERVFGRYVDNNQQTTHTVDYVIGWFMTEERAKRAQVAAIESAKYHQTQIDILMAHINKQFLEKKKVIQMHLSQNGGIQPTWDD